MSAHYVGHVLVVEIFVTNPVLAWREHGQPLKFAIFYHTSVTLKHSFSDGETITHLGGCNAGGVWAAGGGKRG